jgi:hypothetical protein
MARLIKHNADYFTHDADMRNDSKILAVRNRFGLEGYAVWCMTLEALTDKDNFEYPWNELDIELLASDFRITSEKLIEIVEYCQKIKLLSISNGTLFSENHQNRFQSLMSKRNRDREYKSKIIGDENNIIANDKTEAVHKNDIIGDENEQRREEESKVNINNGEFDNSPSELLFENVWNIYEKKGHKKVSQTRWNKLSTKNKKLALLNIPLYIQSNPDKTYRLNFEKYLNQEVWNDELLSLNTNTNEPKVYHI